MSEGGMDTVGLIIAVCVIVPALIAFTVCGIIYFAQRKRNRKLNRQTNEYAPYEYEHSRARRPQDTYYVDYPRAQPFRQQQNRPRQPPPILEQSPPSYEISVNQSQRQNLPLFSCIRTTPITTTNNRSSTRIVSPSVYSAMPPSYAEIFLSPETLPDE